MENEESLMNQIDRIIHKYTQMEKKKRHYGANICLTFAEIHTIDSIGSNDGINITQLALLRGITKGAVSQMIYKLMDKGFVIKQVSPKSDAEIILKLTELGKKVYDAHLNFHKEKNKLIRSKLEKVSKEDYLKLKGAMDFYESMVDEMNRE
ncbi:MarR family winged helix-turn-helix transcriptional regulator [Clostridium oryzae]|uniref:MarR family protein n=1 Tax=Clostridium oryzae TaxID=1450648 RepID=A0A1V4IQM3_9CLOT|nr:MarR family transcriptional regulator [Clostridium oryzae]OPJ62110.1 MarR family protein [Clostridium oryzae]